MSSSYGWIITKDHLDLTDLGIENEAGTAGPRDIDPAMLAKLQKGEGRAFRMYDDDGELYYTGRALAVDGEEDSEEFLFGPLEDYGTPNAGAVVIKWYDKDTRRWEAV